ncbi:MAG: trypsin-like peptidase domain-containing protein [Albidovulum sp.]|nr:trypsin-like peptidase domain-containing protein [Albidovulum sp.]
MLRVLLAVSLAATVAAPVFSETVVPESIEEIRLSFAPVVKRTAPAVVNIFANRVVASNLSPFSKDPFFRQFFEFFGSGRPRVQNSLGSGVIVSADGMVVSNHHVVGDSTDIRVVLSDRREFDAEVVMSDDGSDIALLRLRGAENLPALQFRDSDEIEVGELVLAIGNPFGVGQTVSSGIVSGVARLGALTGNERGYFIQTDAAINPGNSGGALVGMDGRLLGVNTSILTRSGGSNGIGFAIPSNLVAKLVEQAQAGKADFERPWAGIAGKAVDFDMAEVMDMDRPRGMIIDEIHPESPFARSGLRAGDVVMSLDGRKVDAAQEMLYRMSVSGIGESVEVVYLRSGDERTAIVEMELPPEIPESDVGRIGGEGPLRGLVVANANPALIVEANLPLRTEGVVVTGVERSSRWLHLQPGDILRKINGNRVKNARGVRRIARRNADHWVVEFEREGRRHTLRIGS